MTKGVGPRNDKKRVETNKRHAVTYAKNREVLHVFLNPYISGDVQPRPLLLLSYVLSQADVQAWHKSHRV